MKIIHIADIHWRGLSRHDEYTESFEDFFSKCRELEPDIIYVGGDIVHSKTQGISPELIDRLSWWFTQMADICPTHVILGNHDGLILNKHRQDAISPIVSALNNPNIFLYKDSGVYPTGFDGVNWCVFSCFDEEGWKNVRPVEGEINIALFHGAVWGSKTDIDWEIEGEVTVDLFESFDYALLGDIHKTQYLDSKKTIAYCGSTIQQNYGEDPGKGFLLWEINGKDDHTVSFHEVAHGSPFVTIDWVGDVGSVISQASKLQPGARIRVRSKNLLTQAASQELSYRLKSDFNATEVVFKNENQFDSKSYTIVKDGDKDLDLRDLSTHVALFKKYYENSGVTAEEQEELDSLVEKYFASSLSHDETLRNARWQIEKIEFDNLFSYGRGNKINFSNNQGITGIFGKNTKGKSSIIGALMYSMFNTTDRGPIKNLHIINNRKNFCRSSLDIKLNGEIFNIKRGTVKHTTRKGEVYASTSLELKKISASGEVIEDLTEEQRRETEKTLRRLIGNAEDFLMTSLASQGGMNRFLNEGATTRKNILTKFLDLEVFDKMHESCKQDSASIRAMSKTIKKEDWNARIQDVSEKIDRDLEKLASIDREISDSRGLVADLRRKIHTSSENSEEYYTSFQIEKKREENSEIEARKNNLQSEIDKKSEEVEKSIEKLTKIKIACDNTDIDDLIVQRDMKTELEKSIIDLENKKLLAESNLDRISESARKLDLVPCGTSFPTCMFIKDSHEDKKKIKECESLLAQSIESLGDVRKSLDLILDLNPEDKIKKYNALREKQKDLSYGIEILNGSISNNLGRIKNLEDELDSSVKELNRMILLEIKDESDPRIAHQKRIDKIISHIESIEAKKVKCIEKITEGKIQLKNLRDDKDRHDQIKSQMKLYDLFLQASSKKGIPAKIMMSRLPIINSEITNILQGVVDFTVSLQADENSNSMDIFIDYGDSKRVIELASGMEKMISSLAIRAALINTSTLTKTNMIIIDEGFGSLDATNLEACTRLLESLKKWFRNILVISHVDAVKDCVDNSVDIVKKGKNSYVEFI